MELTPVRVVQRLREIADILQERSVLIVNEKKAALARGDEALKQQIGEGRDVMSILRECGHNVLWEFAHRRPVFSAREHEVFSERETYR